MQAFLNGRFIPEEQAVVPISDRGLLYGDGLFESLRVRQGKPLWWDRHLERLHRGGQAIHLALPWSGSALRNFVETLIQQNELPESLLRLTLTRGSGPTRGYSPKGAHCPTLAITQHPLPLPLTPLRLATVSWRVCSSDPLARHKTANRLVHVLARGEAEDSGADEALLLNQEGFVAEAASSNVFWLDAGSVNTPPLSDGALDGVTRALVLELCQRRHLPTAERRVRPEELFRADGVFLTNSVMGIHAPSQLDQRPLPQSPLIAELSAAYQGMEDTELAGRSPRGG